MVYNLRSIGMSLIQNSGQNDCTVKPAKEVHSSSAGSSDTASASSLNNPAGNQSSSSANKNVYLRSYSQQNTNQNHGGDTYVSLMSTFENSRIQPKHKRQRQRKDMESAELQNMVVINLDSSIDSDYGLDLTTPLCDTVDREVFNTSNNSTPNTSSASSKSGSSVNEKKFVCSVLNCAAQFTSEIRLDDHMSLFKHSPCNPCLFARNCSLPINPICYMCPDCDREFSTRDECRQHIDKSNHLAFYPPLGIKAYMCSQCLYLFSSLDACWSHMEQASHHGMYYPFANDYTTDEKHCGPVAVAEELVEDLMSKCSKIVYTVQCLECGMPMETPAILRHHMRETRNQHVVASLTETSLVEVFAGYLASFTCNVCHRLFTGELKELAKHQCAKRIIGTVTENDTRSFAEFIKRCALTVIKSLEMEDMPGPSRARRPSPARDTRSKRVELKCNAATEVSENLSGQWKIQSENASKSNNKDEAGVSKNEQASACQSKQGTSRKGRKSRWDVPPASVVSDVSENSVAAPKLTSSADQTENLPVQGKKEIRVKNTKDEADVITILDTDDSEGTDVDIPYANGAKRKRKKQTAAKSKKGLSDNLLSEPITVSLSPETRKQKSDKLQGSPFFAMNYKPRTLSVSGNVLTQGYVVQPSEDHTSTVHALTSGNSRVQPQQTMTSPVRYRLRNREVCETVTSPKDQNSDPLNFDESFRNIAHTFLQGVSSTTAKEPNSREETLTDLQLCRRDRSRSPLKNLNTLTAPEETNSTSFNIGNFPPQHWSHPPNVLTQGHINQPFHDPFLAVPDVARRFGPTAPSQIAGPSRPQVGNPYSTAIVQPMVPPPVPPPSFLPQTAAQSHLVHPQYVSQVPNPIATCSYPTQAVNPSWSRSNESFYPQAQTTSVASMNKPKTNYTRKPSSENLISTEHLQRMKNIVFLDLDNWPSFFHKLPRCLPDFTFVWGFFGGKNCWYQPNGVAIFRIMRQKGMFYLNERCGTTKDAADFAIVLTVGKMDEKLPSDIAFTIMSGDKGFCEVERQMRHSARKVMVVNPHRAAQFSNDMIYALVTSVTDM